MAKELVYILTLMLAFSGGPAFAGIDLNHFFADPSVTVSADGSSATLAEDPQLSIVLLSNDPGLGDPIVIRPEIGGVGQILSFDWIFDEPAGNDDEFGAFVIDDTGASAGPAFEFFTQDPGSGTVSFDLSSLASQTIGLQFGLTALPWPGDLLLDSSVTISNVELIPVVPSPSALLLAGLGIGILASASRKKCRR